MEFGAEFYVLVAFIVFMCLLGYLGAHRFVLSALDARGQAIADELAEAAKLRAEATALLASFEKKTIEAEAKRRALNEELAAKFAAAESQIAAGRAEAMSSVGDIARDAAGAIVERLIGRPVKAEAIAEAVDSLQAK